MAKRKREREQRKTQEQKELHKEADKKEQTKKDEKAAAELKSEREVEEKYKQKLEAGLKESKKNVTSEDAVIEQNATETQRRSQAWGTQQSQEGATEVVLRGKYRQASEDSADAFDKDDDKIREDDVDEQEEQLQKQGDHRIATPTESRAEAGGQAEEQSSAQSL